MNGYISEAEWQERFDRDQIRDGANILGDVVPIVIRLVMENAQGVWGARVIRWLNDARIYFRPPQLET